jgi:hypothetical protein
MNRAEALHQGGGLLTISWDFRLHQKKKRAPKASEPFDQQAPEEGLEPPCRQVGITATLRKKGKAPKRGPF